MLLLKKVFCINYNQQQEDFLVTNNNLEKETMENLNLNEQKSNPLADLISNEVYETLISRGLINETSVRDREIRKKFKLMRADKMSAGDSIDALREEYPYLQFDTIRKIVYNSPKKN